MKRFIALLCLVSLPVHAYIENRGLFPIGESEALMANAGVALSGSTGSALFNPAGLASLKQNKLSLTGNTYMAYSSELKPIVVYDNQDVNFRLSGTQAIPASFISTWHKEPWTFAFTVAVPELVRSSSLSRHDTANYDLLISQMTDNQFMMIGFGAGTQMENFDVGAGCFIGNYTSGTNITFTAEPKPASGFANAEISSSHQQMDVKNLLCHVGVQKNWNEKTRWGLVLRLPSAHLEGKAQYSIFAQDNAGNRQSSGLLKKSARYDLPMDISFGGANTSFERMTLLADISYQMRQTYTAIEGVDTPTENKGVFRYNLGARFQLHEQMSLVGGYAYNPGSTVLKNSGDMNEDFQSYSIGVESKQGPASMGLAMFRASSKGESQLTGTRRSSLKSEATAVILTTGFTF
ncbi:MAG: hypothetical protein KF789_12945 [Bdellovibrionaceae bacterium]|nr:hypothetical protein [Pseudobdellovibrionaceae bacterium]